MTPPATVLPTLLPIQEHNPRQTLGDKERELNLERLAREIVLQRVRIQASGVQVEECRRKDKYCIEQPTKQSDGCSAPEQIKQATLERSRVNAERRQALAREQKELRRNPEGM